MATGHSVQDIFPSRDNIFIGHIFSSLCVADESQSLYTCVWSTEEGEEEEETRQWLHKDPPHEG